MVRVKVIYVSLKTDISPVILASSLVFFKLFNTPRRPRVASNLDTCRCQHSAPVSQGWKNQWFLNQKFGFLVLWFYGFFGFYVRQLC